MTGLTVLTPPVSGALRLSVLNWRGGRGDEAQAHY